MSPIIYESLVRPIYPTSQDMSSSIFKVICATAAFAASPTAAQIGNWDILYQSLETDFQDSMTNEIIMNYKSDTLDVCSTSPCSGRIAWAPSLA